MSLNLELKPAPMPAVRRAVFECLDEDDLHFDEFGLELNGNVIVAVQGMTQAHFEPDPWDWVCH